MNKNVFFTVNIILVVMLSGCVSYQETGYQRYTSTNTIVEHDISDVYLDSMNNAVSITEEVAEQTIEKSRALQNEGDVARFSEEDGKYSLSQRCGVNDESEVYESGAEQLGWESVVNPTINNDTIDITIEKIDHSVYREGYLVGDFFYEKPYVPSGSTASERINDYFYGEYERFIEGSYMSPDSNSYKRVNELLEEFIESRGAEAIAIQPFTCNVVTKLTFFSEDYISFWQTYRWWATGPRDTWNFGVTFSMKTGKLVSFAEFVDIEANTFKKELCDTLLPLFVEYGQEYVYETYSPNNENTFIARYFDTEVVLDTSYFYDGHSIFLTLNYGLYPHDGFIVKWDDIMHKPFIIWHDDSIIELE